MQVRELLRVDGRRSAQHQVAPRLRLGEGRHLSNVVLVGEQSDPPLHAEGDSAVRRRAVLEGVKQRAELVAHPFNGVAHERERPFEQIIKRFVCGTAVHAQRRVHEMTDSLELLRSLGASTRMTRATRAMLLDVVKWGLPARFDGRELDSIVPVLDAIVGARQ